MFTFYKEQKRIFGHEIVWLKNSENPREALVEYNKAIIR